MPKYTLKLLALVTIFAVAPANAGHRVGPASNQRSAPACRPGDAPAGTRHASRDTAAPPSGDRPARGISPVVFSRGSS